MMDFVEVLFVVIFVVIVWLSLMKLDKAGEDDDGVENEVGVGVEEVGEIIGRVGSEHWRSEV